jgi:uncharacterized protein
MGRRAGAQVTLLDVNLLLYAYDADSRHHRAAAAWIEKIVAGPDLVGLPLPVVWGFLRISTHPRIWANPKPTEEAFRIVKDLLSLPFVVLIHPGARHIEILEALVTEYGATGPLMSDAVLAALAIENGAALASTDRDFSRFQNLRWINPLN